MLYVTTRTDRDAFTPLYAMTHDLAPDGSQFLPMVPPHFDEAALAEVAARSYHENVAHILSLLHRRTLTGWDLDLSIGRNPLSVESLNSRTLVASIRANPDWTFEQLVDGYFRLFEKDPQLRPSQWFTMSVRIAMLFGIFGDLMARGLAGTEAPMDVAVPSFDFQFPMAAWYARQWGLPIGNIVCCCNENNAPWSLLALGQMRTDTALRPTMLEACDQAVPSGLERLIAATLGMDELQRYLTAVEKGRPYILEPGQLKRLHGGLWVSVVSGRRMRFLIPNLQSETGHVLDPYTVMAYAGLADHRAQTGQTGTALLISQEHPIHSVRLLSQALGLSEEALRQRLDSK